MTGFHDGLELGNAARHFLNRKVDQQNGVFRNDTKEHQYADEHGHGDWLSNKAKGDQTTQWSQQQRAHIDQRRHEAMVQKHQHREHQQGSGNQRHEEVALHFLFPFLTAKGGAGHARGQIFHDGKVVDLCVRIR